MASNTRRDDATRAAVSVVVPTYNERERLGDLVSAVFSVFARHHIDGELVIVDDNSPDGTGQLADELSQRYRVRVVHRAGKLGLGTAVIEGFARASSDIVGVIDADLSHPPELLGRMVQLFDDPQVDFVIGSRYVPGGGTQAWEWSRVALSRLACWLARPVTPVHDATSGFFLLRRHVAEGVCIQAGGFKICLELLVRGRAEHVVEVPYVFVGRTAGQSKMNLREASGYARQLWDLLGYRLSDAGRRPLRTYHVVPSRQNT